MFLKKFRKFAKSKLIVLFTCIFINQTILSEGFLAGTLVKTQNSYIQIDQLKIDDLVTSYSFKDRILTNGKITKIQTKHYTTCIKLIIAGKEIITAPDHKFYCPLNEKYHWLKAKDLKPGDFISSNLTECTRIDNVVESGQEADFYCLSIDKYQNFFVSENNIFVHNEAITIFSCSLFGMEFVLKVGIPFLVAGCVALGQRLSQGSYAKPDYNPYISDQQLFGGATVTSSILLAQNLASKKEDNLPINIGDFPFYPPKNKEGKIPKDKTGGFIDEKGNSWNWDPIKSEWDVVDKRGRGHRNVNPKGDETHEGTHPNSTSSTSKSKRGK